MAMIIRGGRRVATWHVEDEEAIADDRPKGTYVGHGCWIEDLDPGEALHQPAHIADAVAGVIAQAAAGIGLSRRQWTRANYREGYLQSDHWSRTRRRILQQRGHKCERCHRITHELQVHHLTYERVWEEWDEDLQVVCVPCHEELHGVEAVR